MKAPQIFISYSWKNKTIADKIYHDLTFVGFDIVKDDHTVGYTDDLSDFMKKVRKVDFALLIISDDYLKSVNCMTEVMHLNKDEDVWEKILPILCKDTKIYDLSDRAKYVVHWQEKLTATEAALKNLDPINAISLYQELKLHRDITQNIDVFLQGLKNRLSISPEEIFDKFYSPITERIKFAPDFSKMGALVPIALIDDPIVRLQTLSNFILEHKLENSYCYSMLASCFRDLGRLDESITLYKKAIDFDDYNYTAWNNIGQVYELFQNYDEAKKAYEKAIIAKPDFDIPRINLGVILASKFNDVEGAKNQYEEIIKFDQNNAKAHTNLANIYRSQPYLDLDKFEKHILISVSQDNVEALINYGNYLKAEKGQIELGNSYYRKAKELDKTKRYWPIIDTMLQSTKG